MKFASTLTAFAALLAGVEAGLKGFNIAANNQDGSCKTTAQWENAFRTLRNTPHKFRHVRLYASSDCNTLANAVPAAKKTGTKIMVGVWATDNAHYEAEKAALRAAIQQHGSGWIRAISVGSEDLYRKDNSPANLARQIRDVRGMVRGMGVRKPITHVDTWTAWVDPANNEVIRACDFVSTDAYPYFQDASIDAAKDVFFKALGDTRRAVHAINPKKKVWVTETSQPWQGPPSGASVASVRNARRYWKDVACTLFKQGVPTYWYAYHSNSVSPKFGVFGPNGKAVHSLKC